MKDLLLPNTVSQKDKKPYTKGLDYTAIPHIKITITEIPLKKKVNTVNRHAPSFRVSNSIKQNKMHRRLNTTASAVNTTWIIAHPFGTSFAEMLVVKDQLESFSLVQSCNRTKKKLAFVTHQFIVKIVVIQETK